ncbi:MAG: SET domain-containing protein-lysine N-methyltransferase [Chlamydiia bacterium]|nr:SET domain-containing protein-lysine N-methyltransferase [Chlamydiia bacterium]
MQKKLPLIHQAIADNDLSAFEALLDRADLEERDPLGFTPRELSVLLGRRDCATRLGQDWHAPFEGTEHYLPCMCFRSYEDLEEGTRLAPLWMQYTPLGKDARTLGERYREAVFSGFATPSEVLWVDPTVGYGRFAQSSIPEGAYIGNYSGVFRKGDAKATDCNSYCFEYPCRFYRRELFMVDSQDWGNETRFMNHSDSPNIRYDYALDRGLLHLLFFATRPIAEGEQMTIDYGPDFWRNRRKVSLESLSC